jgi:hypothetical protein
MKVTYEVPKKFTPITINMVLESKEEADAVHNIFNSCQILEVAGVEGEPIRKAIEGALGIKEFVYNTNNWHSFIDSLGKSFNR